MRNIILILFSLSLISCASQSTTAGDETAQAKTQKKPKDFFSQLHLGRR